MNNTGRWHKDHLKAKTNLKKIVEKWALVSIEPRRRCRCSVSFHQNQHDQ